MADMDMGVGGVWMKAQYWCVVGVLLLKGICGEGVRQGVANIQRGNSNSGMGGRGNTLATALDGVASRAVQPTRKVRPK